MDLMGMAGNLFNYGMAQQNAFAMMVQQMHSGQMPTAQNQWVDPNAAGGIMDPNSLTPGMGLGAGNIPMPPREAFTNFQQLQNAHKQEQETASKDLEQSIDDRKEAFYERNHLVFENGRPARDANGNLRTASGGETRDQRLQRREFERAEKKRVRDEQDARKKEFYARAQAEANSVSPNDPNSKRLLADIQKRLEAEEQQMLRGMQGDVLKAGVPGQLHAEIDAGINNLASLQQRHRADEEGSPDFGAIQNYQLATEAFVQAQRMQLQGGGMGMDPSAGWDPNAMRNAAMGNGFEPSAGWQGQPPAGEGEFTPV